MSISKLSTLISATTVPLVVILLYFIANIGVALAVSRARARGQAVFFLANRSLTPFIFFLTMAATNFSAFTIFGFSGAGYRLGYAFYPLMAFGTGFMALSFAIIGVPLRRLAREHNYITPADFIGYRYQSVLLKKAFSFLLVAFTMPYLALQGMFAGKILQTFAGIPYELGCLLVSIVVVSYVCLGGMRSVAWTDALQGLLIIFSMLLAFIIVANAGGGFFAIHREIGEATKGHFERAGVNGGVSLSFHFSYILLWFFSVPMFPQIFQRFFSAADDKAITMTMRLYPLATTFLFFLTVSMGVMALRILPSLSEGKSDEVLMFLMHTLASPSLTMLIIVGALSALMSTLSSQLLSVSSIIVQDFLPPNFRHLFGDRLVIVALAVAAYLIALHPPLTILGFLSKMSFQGFLACAPAVFLGLFWHKTTTLGAAAGLGTGIGVVLMSVLLPDMLGWLLRGIPEVYLILIMGFGATIVGSLLSKDGGLREPLVEIGDTIKPVWMIIFGGFLVLGCDFWNWNREVSLFWGLPLWMWYFFALGIALFAAFSILSRKFQR